MNNKEIFLTSANFVKSISNISDNLNEKTLYAAIKEAQEIGFQGIVGTILYNKLMELVDNEEINLPSNIYYKELLQKAQYYIAYQSIVSLCIVNSIKIDNSGVNQVSDEHIQNIYLSDVFKVRDYYQNKADYFCKAVQAYCMDNLQHLPEITESNKNKIHANLYSAANTSIYLGGARGFVIPGRVKSNRKGNKYR